MKKVLVVEDNKDLSRMLIKRLEVAGFAVELIEDGYTLLGHLRNGIEPDAIVLDLMLPGRSGIELLNSIVSKWGLVKIFIFSAHSEYENRYAMRSYNICGYFLKSDGMDKLIEKIKDEIL